MFNDSWVIGVLKNLILKKKSKKLFVKRRRLEGDKKIHQSIVPRVKKGHEKSFNS